MIEVFDGDGYCHFPSSEPKLWAVARRRVNGVPEYFGTIQVLVPIEHWCVEPERAELMAQDTAHAMASGYAKTHLGQEYIFSVVRFPDA